MKNKGCACWTFLLGILALVVVCIAAISLVYFQARARALDSRPLVLIHSPVNYEQVRGGDRIIVHATARAGNGLRRIELWVNDTFVDAREVTDGSAPTMLVFSGSWVPITAGNHVLIVRAIPADGTDGQASIVVEVIDSEGASAETHIVQEGETLESIASDYGTSTEELATSNPDLGTGGPVPGDELVLPDDEPPAEEGGAPAEEGSDPPIPEDDAPGLPESVFELLDLNISPFGILFEALDIFAGEPTGLRVEFLDLVTAATYERLHCYLGYADVSPRWFPDADYDPTTDESFGRAGAGSGGMSWSVESLRGDSMPVFYWPRNRAMPVSVWCVGLLNGGTESVEFGRWENSISPDRWTGMTLAGGLPGLYEFTFRITRTNGGRTGVLPFLDPDMTPPTNARLDDRRISLRWDYAPRADEERIDGFRIYLNDNLQWVEPANARESVLPDQWFNPPCGTTYTFAVTAYRFGGLPDGPESLPSTAFLDQPAEDCTRKVLITFLTLETFALGGDGRRPPHHGDVGPVYGHFFANEQRITFDGRNTPPGMVMPYGLDHNTTYNLVEMSAGSIWRFSGMPALLVDIPEGGTFEFGFHIMDQDHGRCRDSDDRGCDDLICEGLSTIYEEGSSGTGWRFDSHNEGTFISEDDRGRCHVTFQWGPTAGSPVGLGVAGWEPLPWILLDDFVVNEDTGQVQLHIRNNGTATWPWRDLTIELQSREGLSLGIYTWPTFVLEPGQRAVLEHPDMRLAAPFDACVLIDPYNDFLEEPERSGAWVHRPICPSVPDLVITDMRYIPSGGFGQISVTLQNVGEGLEHRAISVQTYLPDGAPLYIGGSYPNITLGRFRSITLNFGGVSESIREQMRAGYQVVVNPDGRVFESDTTNNTFVVPAANSLRITVLHLRAPWDYRYSVEFTLTAYAVSGSARRQVANLHFADMDWDSCNRRDGCTFSYTSSERRNSVLWFPIFGDEALEVILRAKHRRGEWTISDSYLPRDNWRANGWGSTRGCSDWLWGTPGWHRWTINRHEGNELGMTFQVCQQRP
ncbi:MAG: LysM peptidoglycan-binding domain-containing protein [Anaerolineales bacterium]|nr:LysM peptidoglycan-binding domain-containing protein [Anaerolineales bacterium]